MIKVHAGPPSVQLPLAVILCLCLITLTSCSEGISFSPGPFPSEEAVLDLSEWSFEEDGAIRISGISWEFYWNKLYTPKDFRISRILEKPAFIPNAQAWNGTVIGGRKLDEDGFATYRLRILLPDRKGPFGFYIQNQDSAYKLWINGRLLAENGIVADTKEEYTPQRLPQLFHFQGEDRELEIVVQVANFTHKWGGLTNSIYMGLSKQINGFANRLYAAVLFLTGSILVMALYHLFLFMYRRKDRSTLFFSLFCFAVFLWYLFTGEYLFFRLFPDFPLAIGIRLNYFSLFAILPAFLLFTESVFSEGITSRLCWIISAAGFLFMLLSLAAPVKFFSRYTLTPYYILSILGIGLVIIIIFRSLLQRKPGTWLALAGILIFFSAALYDMAANRKIIQGSPFGPFVPEALFVFILAQSLILAKKFSRTYADLDSLTVSLEKKVKQRTKELHTAQAKLYEQEKLAAIGTLTGGISHEILNPLSGISGPLSIIKKEISASNLKNSEPVARHLQYIEENVQEISAAVRNLNTLIKDKEIMKAPVLLLPIIEKIINRYDLLESKTITFAVEINKEEEISADPDILYQILGNLVSNAVDAIESKGTVTIRFLNSGARKNIIISDTGRGMERKEIRRAFDPFFTTKEREGGSGLGLYLASKFAASLGWKITIDSRPGEGTGVSIII